MSRNKKKSTREGSGKVRRNTNQLLRELESKLIGIASSSSGTVSRKDIERIENTIDQYYEESKG